MNEPKCYGCSYLIDSLGNYVECRKVAEAGTHMFVDWFYWNDGSPDKCPLKNNEKDDKGHIKQAGAGSVTYRGNLPPEDA